MSKWSHVSRVSGASALQRNTRHCRVQVIPTNWVNKHGSASWLTTCSDDPLHVDMPRGPQSDHPGYVVARGYAKKVTTAKTQAMRAAERVEQSKRKLTADHAHIEQIAKDAEKEARGIARTHPEEAARLRAKARTIREQRFAGRRRRRKSRR